MLLILWLIFFFGFSFFLCSVSLNISHGVYCESGEAERANIRHDHNDDIFGAIAQMQIKRFE